MSNESPFVSDELIAVPEFDGPAMDEQGKPIKPNVIYIRAELGAKALDDLKNTLFKAEMRPGEKMQLMEMHVNQDYELLKAYIAKWSGPLYDRVPLTNENVARLKTKHPHIKKVLDKISEQSAEQQEQAESPDPNLPALTGSAPHGAPASEAPAKNLWERTTSSSSSVNSTQAGHLEILPH